MPAAPKRASSQREHRNFRARKSTADPSGSRIGIKTRIVLRLPRRFVRL
jgi:hypothetical protein